MLTANARAASVVRPVAGVRIAAGHPLAQGLRACFLFNEAGGSVVRDVVDNAEYGTIASWGAAPGVAPGAALLNTIGAGVGVMAPAPSKLQVSAVTMVWRGVLAGTPVDLSNIAGVSYDSTASTPNWAYGVRRSGSNFVGIYNRAGTSQTVGSTGVTVHPKNQETSFAVTVRSGAQSLYTRGQIVSSSSFSFGSINYGAAPQLCIGGKEPDVTTRDASTQHLQVLIYDRVLSASEIQQLWVSPYCFLQQSHGARYYTFGASEAAGITGTAGIVTAESFGAGGVVAGPITGSAGIDESAMGSVGSLVAGLVAGTAGITSDEAFGADGALGGPITGVASIDESAMGVDGSVSGPVTGGAGIVSAEAFGSGGVVAGPILGSTGIVSLEAFGSGGDIQQPITGISGIASGEAFGAGSITAGMRGYIGITSAETFGRGGAVLPSGVDFHLFIRGLSWTALKQVTPPLSVTKEFGGRGQASFTLCQTGTGFRPAPGDEVEYYCGSRKLFGGFLKTVEEEYFVASQTFLLRCTASDYRDVCDTRTFSRVYEGPTHTLSVIIGDMMAAVLTAEGITYESREDYTITGGKLAFNDEPLGQCLDRVCAIYGCDWRIDDYRRLRIERRLADLAPLTLSDNDGRWEKMVVKRSDAQYRNRQGARTSTPTAGQRTSTLTGGGAWTYTLPWQVKGKPTILVNDVAKTVVLYSQRHTQPWDFAYELDGATIYHNPAQSAYTSSDEIAITALSANLDVYWTQNTNEIARRAAQTGGSGIVESVSQARNIREAGNAARFTEGMMARLGQATVEVQVELSTCDMGPPVTPRPERAGWDIGQLVSIACARPLVAGDFVIRSMAFQEAGGRFLRYQLTCAGRELPAILGIEVSGGPDPGTWEVEVAVDRPVDWLPGTDISLWGLNNLGDTDPLNGSWVIDSIDPDPETGGVLIRFTPPDLDLTDYTYTGGLGGTDGSGGSGWGGDSDPWGGVISTSGILPGGVDGGSGISNPATGALIVENVNTSTREVTVDRDHGFTTGYPAFDTGTRVVILGVRGAEDLTHSINTPFSRITVTGARTFIPEDVGPFTSPSPFENDRRGRVYTTDQAPRFGTGGGNPDSTNILSTLNATTTEGNALGGNATFLLANSVPGFASRPLMVMNAATNPWIQQRDLQVVESVNVEVGTPSQGGPIRIDIKKNGASIFAAGYVEIPAGETSLRTSELVSSPLVVEKDDRLQPDVVAVGSEFPGCNVRVDVVMRG